MKSKRLYNYLLSLGLLDASEEEQKQARLRYRRAYKRQWAAHKRKKQREVRFSLSKKQFNVIQEYCKRNADGKQSPTALARTLLLEKTQEVAHIPNRKNLEDIYRKLGLCINKLFNSGDRQLVEELEIIEQQLQNYLNNQK